MNTIMCKYCATFFFAFATHKFQVDNANINCVNNPTSYSNLNEDLERSGIFGLYHHPLASTLTQTLITGNS
jgi:hypothetical protein